MKTVLTIFLGACLSFCGFSQAYHPIPEKDAWWCESYCWGYGFCNFYEQRTIYPGPQVMIDSTYYTLYLYNASVYSPAYGNWCPEQDYWVYGNGYAYLRNDSVNRKVYTYDISSSTEHLLYDFNVAVGDTIPAGGLYYLEEQYVDSIDSVDIGMGYRKRIYLHSAYDDDIWIEGIGSKISLGQRSFYTTHCRWSISFSQNNITYPPEFVDYCLAPIGIEPIESLQNYIHQVGLNKWMINSTPHSLKIYCYDMMGRQLFANDYNENDILDLNDISSGVYVLHANIQGKPCQPLKIMVQH